MAIQYFDYPLQVHEYADRERVYASPIELLDRTDAPLLEILGGLNKANSWSFVGNPATKVEWLQEEYDKLIGKFTVAEADTTEDELTVDDASNVQVHSILRVDTTGELLWVSAVNRTTNVITVTRGFGDDGVAAAAIALNAPFTLVGFANLSGDDYYDLSTSTYWSEWNYSQIFQSKFSISGTLKEVPNQIVGIADPYAREQIRVIRKIMQTLDRSLHYGVRSANIGTDTAPRTFGGYPYFIKTNVKNQASFTLEEINDVITEVVDYGNTNPVVVASPKQYAHFKSFVNALPGLAINYNTTTLGYQVTTIDGDFGQLNIVKNIRQPDSIMPIFSLNDVGMLTIRPLKEEELPKTADRYEWNAIGEYTFCLRNEKRHALFVGLSLT